MSSSSVDGGSQVDPPQNDAMSEQTCESCGAPADVQLDDGSLWCISCDNTARILGYDNRAAMLLNPPYDYRPDESVIEYFDKRRRA